VRFNSQNMKVNVMLFGPLTDITRSDNLVLEDVADTDGLMATLHKAYPGLADSKYLIAVDKKIISVNTLLKDDSTIALLPPFSGG
jgi:molybdopterin synthase sulfur carrier subunit